MADLEVKVNELPALTLKALRGPGETLQGAYLAQLRNVLAQAVRRYRDLAGLGLAASADWTPPTVADVMAIKVSTTRIRRAQRNALAVAAGRARAHSIPGVDFNLTGPFPQSLLDQLGVRAADLDQALREPVAAAIARGWAEGLSVPDTAALIQKTVRPQLGSAATMLARTDLISLSNGSSAWAVDELNRSANQAGEPGPFSTKTWLATNDSRTRQTHREANGQTVPIKDQFTVGGAGLDYPGDPSGPSAEIINCRCTQLFNEAPAKQPVKQTVEPGDQFARVMEPQGFKWSTFPQTKTAVEEMNVFLDSLLPGGIRKEAVDKLRVASPSAKLSAQVDPTLAAHGEYRYLGGSPLKITINPGTVHPRTTWLHEVGHYIDHQAVDTVGTFATEVQASPAVKEFLALVNGSRPVAALWRMKLSGRTVDTWAGEDMDLPERMKAHVDYLLEPAEMWARAFAQWSARRSATARPEMDEQIDMDRIRGEPTTSEEAARFPRSYWTPSQWEWDEFDEIDDAVTNVLKESGLLAQALSAAGMVDLAVAPGLLATVVGGEPVAGRDLVQPLGRHDDPDDLVVGVALGAEGVGVDDRHGTDDTAAGSSGQAAIRFDDDDREDDMSATELDTAQTATGAAWESDLAFEGLSTGDGRYIAQGALSWREPPLTLMAMIETPDFGGHAGAQVAGRMDTFTKERTALDGSRLPDGVTAIRGRGVFDIGEFGSEIERMVGDNVLTGVSVDMAVNDWALRDPTTGEIIPADEASEAQWEAAFLGELEMAITDADIMAATVCPTPAFADAKIALVAASRSFGHTWRTADGQLCTTVWAPVRLTPAVDPLTAAASIPVKPPRDWFFTPEADHAVPLTFTADGQVFGHIAAWESCHTGFINGDWSQCVTPPRSNTGYAHFHVGEIPTKEGDLIPVGKLMLGEAHAPGTNGRAQARAYYDRTGTVGAYVRAVDGQHGIWVAGCIRDGLTDAQRRDLHVNPPSGDWRAVDRNLELIAAIAVPVPGFPIPRSQMSLAASADGDMYVSALILTGGVESEAFGIEAAILAAAIEDDLDSLFAE